jgi:hypothetical protein
MIRISTRVERVRVVGDSMAPLIPSGAWVRFVPGARPRFGDVVVARAGGRLLVHRVIGHRRGRVLLRGDAACVPDAPIAPIDVVGRVVAVEGPRGHALASTPHRGLGRLAAIAGRVRGAPGLGPTGAMLLRAASAITPLAGPAMPAEERLVLLLARLRVGDADRGAVQVLGERGLDWRRVVDLAVRAQLAPLLHVGVRRALAGSPSGAPTVPGLAVPEMVRAQLRRAYLGSAVRHDATSRVLGDVLRRLAAHRIDVLVHKGALLQRTVYPDPALRLAGDIDLSVRDDDLARARRAVASVLADVHACHPDRRSTRSMHVELDGPLHHDVDLSHHGGGHWRTGPLDAAGMWRRARPMRMCGVVVRVPDPTDVLVTLVANAIRRGCSPLRLVADVAAVAEVLGPEIDWNRFARLAKTTGLTSRAWVPLRLARDAFGAPLPAWTVTPPTDLAPLWHERMLLAWKLRRPFHRMPTRVLWAGSYGGAASTALRQASAVAAIRVSGTSRRLSRPFGRPDHDRASG